MPWPLDCTASIIFSGILFLELQLAVDEHHCPPRNSVVVPTHHNNQIFLGDLPLCLNSSVKATTGGECFAWQVFEDLLAARKGRAVGVPVVRAAARKKKKGKGKRGLVTRKAGNKASGAVKSSSKTTRKIPRGRVRRSRSKGTRR